MYTCICVYAYVEARADFCTQLVSMFAPLVLILLYSFPLLERARDRLSGCVAEYAHAYAKELTNSSLLQSILTESHSMHFVRRIIGKEYSGHLPN